MLIRTTFWEPLLYSNDMGVFLRYKRPYLGCHRQTVYVCLWHPKYKERVLKIFKLMSIYPLRLLHLTISDQAFSVNHAGAGFSKGFSKATPPVRRKATRSSSKLRCNTTESWDIQLYMSTMVIRIKIRRETD